MPSPSRRSFLGASLASLMSGRLFGADPAAEPVPRETENPAFQPSTLFLTWQRDPTTTMTVQWVGTAGETADATVHYTPAPAGPAPAAKPGDKNDPWQKQPTATKPYPMTDFKVFRAELTGLRPGTDYLFRIGKSSAVYRFRTMLARATDTIHFISGGDCG